MAVQSLLTLRAGQPKHEVAIAPSPLVQSSPTMPEQLLWFYEPGSAIALSLDPSISARRWAQATPTYLQPAPVRVVVDLSDRTLSLRQGHRQLASYPVAVGKEGWETPVGRYQVIQMQKDPAWEHPLTKTIVDPGPDNPLGDAWIGFKSEAGFSFGFHGTNNEWLIGEAASHGCVRMLNADILDLFDRLQVGTEVQVKP